jgi:hypothetical protein
MNFSPKSPSTAFGESIPLAPWDMANANRGDIDAKSMPEHFAKRILQRTLRLHLVYSPGLYCQAQLKLVLCVEDLTYPLNFTICYK